MVNLIQLSATSRILHLQVHHFFTCRLSDQAKKYPEIRDSLSRLGWTKEHNDWSCDCFKLVAGPGFTWRQMNEHNAMRPSSLVSFKSSAIVIGPLSSYDQVLAFSLKKPMPNARHALCIYNPSTLSKITEIDLIAYEDIRNVQVSFITFAKDTMAIYLKGYGRNILIWKINTKEPKEEGIALLQTIAPPPPDYMYINPSFGLNDRFIAILEGTQVKVRSRSDGALVCQIGRGGIYLAEWALEKEQGDHIAFAFFSYSKLVFQIFSVTQGHIIIQKELVEWPFQAVRYMEWFGPHLVVILEKSNVLSMMSWQPGLTSFLSCPSNVPVVRRSSRGGGGGASEWAPGGGGASEWAADCVHVDYGGITLALKNGIWNSRSHMRRYE